MEQDRRDRDRRIEDALVEVILAVEARDHAGRLAEYAETRIGGALRRLLADDVDVAQAAQLCQLTVHDVRRLSRHRRTRRSQPEPAPTDVSAVADQSSTEHETGPTRIAVRRRRLDASYRAATLHAPSAAAAS